MTILSIRTVGDPVLRSVCDPITVFDDDLARLIDDMLETMYDVGGVGLAGPQIGISKQIFTFGGGGAFGAGSAGSSFGSFGK